jgi:FkbM family methyltransferase
MGDSSFVAMLRRLAPRFSPATIIDVGASDGQWSKMARTVWPKAALVLVEANPVFEGKLLEFCEAHGAKFTKFSMSLAGATRGGACAEFNVENPYQGVAVNPGSIVPTVDVIPLDAFNVDGPCLLKLDVHRHEPMIFEGAKEVLSKTGAVVVEVYFWEPAAHALRFWELVALMARYGFRPTDLCEPVYRPSDGRCAQVDMLFERADAPGMDKWW